MHGALDILVPSNTKFHKLDVDIGTLDLRTIQYLFPSFPRLEGTVSGTATLDSSWLDTRFHNADLVHHNGALPISHFTGDGRVTQAPKFTAFDVTLQAQPLSFTTFAHSYPGLAFRGNFSGPLRIRGTMDDLDVTANLSGDAGTMVVNGNFDLDTTSGLAGRGTASVADLDVQELMDRTTLPSTSLAGRAAFDVHGDSIANLTGSLSIDLDQSRIRADGSIGRQRGVHLRRWAHARGHAESREQRRAPLGEGIARARAERRRFTALRRRHRFARRAPAVDSAARGVRYHAARYGGAHHRARSRDAAAARFARRHGALRRDAHRLDRHAAGARGDRGRVAVRVRQPHRQRERQLRYGRPSRRCTGHLHCTRRLAAARDSGDRFAAGAAHDGESLPWRADDECREQPPRRKFCGGQPSPPSSAGPTRCALPSTVSAH